MCHWLNILCVYYRESGSSKQRDNWDSTEKLEPIDVNIPLLVIGTKQVNRMKLYPESNNI